MTFILFIAVFVMAVMLQDTRKRLHRMEGLVRELEMLFEKWARERADDNSKTQHSVSFTRAGGPWAAAPAPQSAPLTESEETTSLAVAQEENEPTDAINATPEAEAVATEETPQAVNQPTVTAEPIHHETTSPPDQEADTTPQSTRDEPSRRSGGFEDLFGRKLPIWAGGITLAVAGILLVKYSIDAGLLSPTLRILFGLLFGAGLIGGAETALRQRDKVQDDRVHQALAGAGIASLYAAVLAAANLYHLIGPGLAFGGLVVVTALAMALSLRFGAPSAVLGLAGGLAAPALVQAEEPNIPLLCTYLALAMGGLGAISRRQRWMWLGVSALVGGAGWGLLLIVKGGLDMASTLSVGVLVMLAGLALPVLVLPQGANRVLRAGGALVAAGQIALLVATGGFAPLQWGLYGLLSVGMLWLTHRESALRLLPAIGLATGLLLTMVWPTPPMTLFSTVMAAIILLYGGSALWRLWRTEGSMLEAGQIIGLSLGGFFSAWLHFHAPEHDTLFALIAVLAAALPAGGAIAGWGNAERYSDARFSALATASAVLLAIAGLVALPGWTAPVVIAGLSSGLLLLAAKAQDHRLTRSAQGFWLTSAAALLATDEMLMETGRLFGVTAPLSLTAIAPALVRWGAVGYAAAMLAWRLPQARIGALFQVIAVCFGYGAAAQIIPSAYLGAFAALALAVFAEANRRLDQRNTLVPAFVTSGIFAALWALEQYFGWLMPALLSLGGDVLTVTQLPTARMAAERLLLPSILAGVAIWRHGFAAAPGHWTKAAIAITGAFGIAAVHILYKQIFAIQSDADFLWKGLAERSLWQALLIALGYGLWRWRPISILALVPIGMGVAHGLYYNMALYNPLWAAQMVGTVPVANLLLPAFGLPLIGLWLTRAIKPDLDARLIRAGEGVTMLLLMLFAFATLRQMFVGPILVSQPIGSLENILWSVVAIAVAIAFLLWGIRERKQDWRIASLLLMLAAVGKVFLLDASGLEGLLRIASFLALGFSLIGIGWVYSRFWREKDITEQESDAA